ncbi:MAG: hypothetical protein QOF44_3813, partial [Streptomyces sp.]|nr:hypothetical protein [Streptomyces sp.]
GERGPPPEVVADHMAEERIQHARVLGNCKTTSHTAMEHHHTPELTTDRRPFSGGDPREK